MAIEATAPAPKAAARKSKLPDYVVGLLIAIFGGILAGYMATRWIDIPKVEQLEKYRPDVVTEVRAADGRSLGRFAIERRIVLPPDRVPALVKQAILAIEDRRFYQHGGIDPIRLVRAGLYDLAAGRAAQGASTLTQQLAKMLFLTPEKTIRRKVNEMLLAFEIERRFSKDQILAMYVNQVYLGRGNYGFEAASRDFFGRHASELRPEEAALLAGLVQRPTYFNPATHPDRARERRDLVLYMMGTAGYLAPEDVKRAQAMPVSIPGPSTQEKEIGSYFTEEVRQEIEKGYGEKGLYRAGLRVDTTLDPELQAAAEAAVREGVRRVGKHFGWRGPVYNVLAGNPKTQTPPQPVEGAVLPEWKDFELAPQAFVRAIVVAADRKSPKVRVGTTVYQLRPTGNEWTWQSTLGFLKVGDVVEIQLHVSEKGAWDASLELPPYCQGALVAIENRTGAVRALVGGESFRKSKFDRATQAYRQAGSAFKPFVFVTALEKGMTAADTIFDGPVTFTAERGLPPYSPHNYYKKYFGIQTLQRALELSHNVSAVKLLMMLGPSDVIERAQRLGVVADFKPYPSMALGAFEVDLLRMTAAYAVFPSGGIYQPPYLISRISDAEGRPLDEHVPEPVEAVTPQVAYQMVAMLKGVVDRGTATEAKKLQLAMGGKTGTTDDYADAWFIGFTPTMTVGVWIGHDAKKPLGKGMTGGKAALPVWMRFMEAAKIKDPGLPKLDFEVPPGLVVTPVDVETGRRAMPSCRLIALVPTPAGAEPTEECNDRWNGIAAAPASLQRPFYTPKPNEVMGVTSYIPPSQDAAADRKPEQGGM